MELVIEHLQKYFEDKHVLEDIDFRFEKGKIYGLLGRNGAGKTTLFNCLNQDLPIDQGKFYILDGNEQRKVTTGDIGYVYQHLLF
ncbi:MAG: ATP-binding cassette domain-containing protein [Longibaculum sp.]